MLLLFLQTRRIPANILARSNIGGIIVAVMMQQLNQKHPDEYLPGMRILWGPIGIMIVFWLFIPESPWFHARRGNKDKAMKAMKQLYGNVEGYDYEEEFAIITRTIEHEKQVLREPPKYSHIFKGLNLVCLAEKFDPYVLRSNFIAETNTYRFAGGCRAAVRRPRHYLNLLDLFVSLLSFTAFDLDN